MPARPVDARATELLRRVAAYGGWLKDTGYYRNLRECEELIAALSQEPGWMQRALDGHAGDVDLLRGLVNVVGYSEERARRGVREGDKPKPAGWYSFADLVVLGQRCLLHPDPLAVLALGSQHDLLASLGALDETFPARYWRRMQELLGDGDDRVAATALMRLDSHRIFDKPFRYDVPGNLVARLLSSSDVKALSIALGYLRSAEVHDQTLLPAVLHALDAVFSAWGRLEEHEWFDSYQALKHYLNEPNRDSVISFVSRHLEDEGARVRQSMYYTITLQPGYIPLDMFAERLFVLFERHPEDRPHLWWLFGRHADHRLWDRYAAAVPSGDLGIVRFLAHVRMPGGLALIGRAAAARSTAILRGDAGFEVWEALELYSREEVAASTEIPPDQRDLLLQLMPASGGR